MNREYILGELATHTRALGMDWDELSVATAVCNPEYRDVLVVGDTVSWLDGIRSEVLKELRFVLRDELDKGVFEIFTRRTIKTSFGPRLTFETVSSADSWRGRDFDVVFLPDNYNEAKRQNYAMGQEALRRAFEEKVKAAVIRDENNGWMRQYMNEANDLIKYKLPDPILLPSSIDLNAPGAVLNNAPINAAPSTKSPELISAESIAAAVDKFYEQKLLEEAVKPSPLLDRLRDSSLLKMDGGEEIRIPFTEFRKRMLQEAEPKIVDPVVIIDPLNPPVRKLKLR